MSASTAPAAPRPTLPTGHPALLVLGAIGVVFGDIGTSPLYALKEAFSPKYGIPLTHDERARHPLAHRLVDGRG